MNKADIQDIQVELEQAKEQAELGKAIDRLFTSSPDFKRVFIDGYFKEEPVRLVYLKADPNMQTPDSQSELIKQMDAIGSVRQYLNAMRMLGRQSEGAIQDYEAELEFARAED